MKVLMVNKFLYPRGGAETYMLGLGEALEALGHEVTYFGMADEQNTVGNAQKLTTRNMDFHQSGAEKLLYPFHILYSFEAKKKLSELIDAFKPDVVHLNNINFQLTPSVIDAAYAKGVPVVQTVHDLQMLCPNHLMFNPNTGEVCEKCLHHSAINCVKGRCIHGSLAKSALGTVEMWLYQARKNYDHVARFICPSQFIADMLAQKPRFVGKTAVIRNFIRVPERRAGTVKGDYVLYFGRLAPEKGIDALMGAARKLPEVRFVVAGSGPLEDMCKGIDNVEFVGFQTGDKLQSLIAEAKLSVYPSVWYENCPLSVLESQALGTPVLASRMGGVPELIEDGHTGVLVDKVSAETLAEAISLMLSDEARLNQMSEECLAKRDDMMTAKRYAELTEAVYRDVVKGG